MYETNAVERPMLIEMNGKLLRLILLIVVCCVHKSSANDIEFGQRNVGNTFLNLTGVSLLRCKSECETRLRCLSFNYKRVIHRCELNFRLPSTNFPTVRAAGYIYRKIRDQSHMDHCDCSYNKRCHPDGSCITDMCWPLLSPANSTQSGNMNTVGSRTSVSWPANSNDFSYSPSVISYVCDENAQWSQEISSDELRGTCMKVFRGNAQVGGDFYDTWKTGSSSSSMIHCVNSERCNRVHYRHDAIDNWNNLNISSVRFSVYKQGVEAQYVVFNATYSDSTNWFSYPRVIETSWTSLMSISSLMVSMEGRLDRPGLTRRFYIAHQHDGCDNDLIWFTASSRSADVPCEWDGVVKTDTPYKVKLMYSIIGTPGNPNTETIATADEIEVAVCF